MQTQIKQNTLFISGIVNVRTLNADMCRAFAKQCTLPEINALDFAEERNIGGAPVTIYGLSNPYIYTILVKNIDPFTFNEKKVMNGSGIEAVGNYQFYVRDVSPEQVYLVRTGGWVPEEIRQQDFNLKEFGTVTVYYP